MVSVTAYKIYLTGSLSAPQWEGDIDRVNHNITITPVGSALISVKLVNLLDGFRLPVIFQDDSISFTSGLPTYVSWAVMSPNELLITSLNAAPGSVPFVLFQSLTPHGAGIDPTIINTYQPPP